MQRSQVSISDIEEYYGEAVPPKYNLRNAKSPVAIHHSSSDPFLTPDNARKLIEALPNVVLDYFVPHKDFNQGDFVYGGLLSNSKNNEVDCK